MKRFFIAGAGVVGLSVVALAAALWLMPSDVVVSSYPTLDAARRDRLFERGWLPEVLPPSSSRIEVSNNLDLNTSWGSFEFQPREWPLLEGKLAPGSLGAPFVGWDKEVAERREQGYEPWHHVASDSRWVFFCKRSTAQCDYVMWVPREG